MRGLLTTFATRECPSHVDEESGIKRTSMLAIHAYPSLIDASNEFAFSIGLRRQ
jgi:hypothetical protein